MLSNHSYNDCIKHLFGLGRFGIKLGLDVISNILENLENPQNNFPCIHIAGTNGKGSIAANLSSILSIAKYKTGLYTSPHLVNFNERICINNIPITDEDIVESYLAVKNIDHGEREATFFEYVTAMALDQFSKKQVDIAIIETGMGGRLDATNIIKPIVSIISNLSLEHQTYLGDTLSMIAKEKGGIIKKDIPVITGVKQEEALDAIKNITSLKSSDLYCLGNDFKTKQNKDNSFNYYGINTNFKNLKTSLLGEHQIENSAIAVAACEILNTGLNQNKKLINNISFDNINEGLKDTKWPGRLEIVMQSPLVIIDGAHNLNAAQNLAKYLSNNFSYKKLTMVIGILDDKPYEKMLNILLPHCNKLIITQPKINRSLKPETLYNVAKNFTSDIKIIQNVEDATEYAIKKTAQKDVVCIAGSLYVAGEAKQFINSYNTNI